MSENKALRYNSGKLDLLSCPSSTIEAVAAVFEYNHQKNGGKYPEGNWELGQDYRTALASIFRHIIAFNEKEDLDRESGLPHLWHALAGLSMLNYYYMHLPKELDNRRKVGDLYTVAAILNNQMKERNEKK